MPLPMVHLGVAVRYFEECSVPDLFVLGSIAPDSIHMRKGAGREDKSGTHFGGKEADPETLEQHYFEWINRNADQDWKWYVKGYFAHILTDYFWGKSVYAGFKAGIEKDKTSSSEIKTYYYVETDQIDFLLYETQAWKDAIWEKLVRAPAYAMDPLLSEKEVDAWRLRTIQWFQQSANKPGIEPQYITLEVVETFIERTGDEIREIIAEWDRRLSDRIG